MPQSSEKLDIYPQVLEWLASGAVRPGERIGEESLGMRWNVSRMPAREALIRLEHEGIVTRKPGSGTFIRKISPQELIELYELRAGIESVTIRHTARVITDEQLTELSEMATTIDRSPETVPRPEAIRVDRRFHERLAEISGLRHAQRLLKHNSFFARSFILGAEMNVLGRPYTLHDPIVDALRLRDPDSAERAMQEHFEAGKKALAQHANEIQED